MGILGYHFSGSSDTNHDSLLSNTTYTGPPRLRYLFQVVQTQTMAAYCRIYLHWTTTFRIFFQVVQTQTTTACCTEILLKLHRHPYKDIFLNKPHINFFLFFKGDINSNSNLLNRNDLYEFKFTNGHWCHLAHRRKVNIGRLGQSERRTLFRSIILE